MTPLECAHQMWDWVHLCCIFRVRSHCQQQLLLLTLVISASPATVVCMATTPTVKDAPGSQIKTANTPFVSQTRRILGAVVEPEKQIMATVNSKQKVGGQITYCKHVNNKPLNAGRMSKFPAMGIDSQINAVHTPWTSRILALTTAIAPHSPPTRKTHTSAPKTLQTKREPLDANYNSCS